MRRRTLLAISIGSVVAVGAVLLPGVPAAAAPGSLDGTFDGDGLAVAGFSGTETQPNAVVVQGDGKIVVAGTVNRASLDFGVVRYRSDGTLDPDFGTNGKAFVDFGGGYDRANAVALQPDGKIVVVGQAAFSGFAIARFNPDGSPDATFSGDGKTTTRIHDGDTAWGYGVVIQPDGKIVVGGTAELSDEQNRNDLWFALVRYRPGGAVDRSFGADGIVTTYMGPGAFAESLVRDANGRLFLVGWYDDPRGDRVAIARYRHDGALDTTFGNGGRVRDALGQPTDVVIQPDGRLAMVGYFRRPGVYGEKLLLARYHPNGTRDATFGSNGVKRISFTDLNEGTSLAVEDDGKLVAAGWTSDGTGSRFSVMRFSASGSPDGTFGTNGLAAYDLPDGHEAAMAVTIQPDGRIVATGYKGVTTTDWGAQINDWATLRLMPT